MSRTVINVTAILSATEHITAAKRNAEAARNSFVGTTGGVDEGIKNRSNIRARINTVRQTLSTVELRLGQIRSMVQSGANRYRLADEQVNAMHGRGGDEELKQLAAFLVHKVKPVIEDFAESAVEKAKKIKDFIFEERPKRNEDGVPYYIINNEKVIAGQDYTRNFLKNRNQGFDAFACAWSSDWIQNVLGLVGIGDDMNEAACRRSIETLIRTSLESKHEMSDTIDDHVNALTPEEYEQFKSVVDYTAKHKKIMSQEEIAALLEVPLEEVSKSEFLKFLSNQKSVMFFDNLSNCLGAYSDTVETVDVVGKIVGRLTNDYTEDLEMLDSLETAMIEGGYDQEIVKDTISDIRNGYEYRIQSSIAMGLEAIAQKGVEEFVEDSLPAVDFMLAAKDIGCTVTGLEDKTQNLEMIYVTQHYSQALIDQYELYAEKVRSGNYTPEELEQCETYFELARNAKIQEYQAMQNLYIDARESFSSIFKSEEEKTSIQGVIDTLDDEIWRLEHL